MFHMKHFVYDMDISLKKYYVVETYHEHRSYILVNRKKSKRLQCHFMNFVEFSCMMILIGSIA